MFAGSKFRAISIRVFLWKQVLKREFGNFANMSLYSRTLKMTDLSSKSKNRKKEQATPTTHWTLQLMLCSDDVYEGYQKR